MMQTKNLFLPDIHTTKEHKIIESGPILDYSNILRADISYDIKEKSDCFAEEIEKNFLSDFKKNGDMMVHVSSFAFIKNVIYMTYYASQNNEAEDPKYHTARLVYCPADDVENKTYIDLQAAGDTFGGKTVDAVYDTILMHKDDETIYLMWTAMLSGNYYRLYRTFNTSEKTFSEIKINKLKIDDFICDFSYSGIQTIFAEKNLGYKKMYSDIGIMQKISSRTENGEVYYYTGAYSGDHTFIIKSKDLETWEFVAQPDFVNESKWENATYVKDDKCYYFVRQKDESPYGFLTVYHLKEKIWEKPVLIEDCQSRADFIEYGNHLYLFHAPIDREHIGIVHINCNNIKDSSIVLQAKMKESCFYPFVQYGNGALYMSYTVNRHHIKLAKFDAKNYLNAL